MSPLPDSALPDPAALRDPEQFIRSQTVLTSPPLLPELQLHLASEALPLWQATEAWLEQAGLPPPYWAFAWPGGIALARLLLDRPELVAGRSVVDVGAGSGLTSLAAARAGARRVTAADIDPISMIAVALNAAANGLTVETLQDDVSRQAPDAWDVVLFGDMCYEKALADLLLPWGRAVARSGRLVLLADPGRAYRPQDGLAEIARVVVPTSLDLEDRTEREAIIWRLLA